MRMKPASPLVAMGFCPVNTRCFMTDKAVANDSVTKDQAPANGWTSLSRQYFYQSSLAHAAKGRGRWISIA